MILALASALRFLFYLLSAYFLARPFWNSGQGDRGKGMPFLVAGFLLGAGILAWRAGLAGALPLFTRFDLLGLFAFTVTAAYLILLAQKAVQGLGAVILPVPLGALVFGLWPQPLPAQISARLQDPWVSGHILLFFMAYSALLLGFGLAVLYLVLERQLKAKKITSAFYRLPSLVELDETLGRSEALGFICLTAAVAVAERSFRSIGLVWTLDPKMIFIFASWAVYALYLYSRLLMGWRGRRSAVFSVLAFLFVLAAFVASELAGPGHGNRA